MKLTKRQVKDRLSKLKPVYATVSSLDTRIRVATIKGNKVYNPSKSICVHIDECKFDDGN